MRRQSGRYEIGDKIGSGAHGSVYVAHDTARDERCCIKQVLLTHASEKEAVRAEMEMKLLSALAHPGIVSFRDCFSTHESVNCVMEYCEGGDLSQVVRNHRRSHMHLAEETIVDWLIQITLALDHVHNERVLHRDLKLHNIFLTDDGLVKIGDFGIAKALGSVSGATSCIGTPQYMAPEVVQGEVYSFAADVWSLGCVVHELCSLERAFYGTNFLAIVYAICKKEPPLLPDIYSDELRELVWAMLAKEPSARPSLADILHSPLVSRRLATAPPPPGFLSQMGGVTVTGTGTGSGTSTGTGMVAADDADDDDNVGELILIDGSSLVDGAEGAPAASPERAPPTSGHPLDLVRRPIAQVGELLRRVGKATRPAAKLGGKRWTARAAEDGPPNASGGLEGEVATARLERPVSPSPLAESTGVSGAGVAPVGPIEWYYLDAADEQNGPVDDEMLLLLHVLGDIDDGTRVWRDGMYLWEPLWRVPGALPELREADERGGGGEVGE